jgi:hypothetical protein
MLIASSVFSALSCTSFKVSVLVLRFLVYFELVLLQGERHLSNFSFLNTKIQFSQKKIC